MKWPSEKDLQAKLLDNIEEARRARAEVIDPVEFDFSKGEPKFDFDSSGSWIYVIEDNTGELAKTVEAYEKKRPYPGKNTYKLPKFNKPVCEHNPDHKILYVGSSTGGRIKTRLKQHFSAKEGSTYALRLRLWWPSGKGKVYLRRYKVGIDVLQLIEDGFSEQLKPVFGKLGGNGR